MIVAILPCTEAFTGNAPTTDTSTGEERGMKKENQVNGHMVVITCSYT